MSANLDVVTVAPRRLRVQRRVTDPCKWNVSQTACHLSIKSVIKPVAPSGSKHLRSWLGDCAFVESIPPLQSAFPRVQPRLKALPAASVQQLLEPATSEPQVDVLHSTTHDYAQHEGSESDVHHTTSHGERNHAVVC